MLLLFFLYLGHIALTHAFDDAERGDRGCRILALAGAINLPIIKFSVDWNTLHQPASRSTKLGGPTIHPTILMPLIWMAARVRLLFVLLVLVRTETEIDRRRPGSRTRTHEQLCRLHPVGLPGSAGDPGRAHHRLLSARRRVRRELARRRDLERQRARQANDTPSAAASGCSPDRWPCWASGPGPDRIERQSGVFYSPRRRLPRRTSP